MRACHTFELPSFRKVRSQDTKDRFGIVYYYLRYHLWVGVRREWSGTNSTTTERKAHRRDQTGPDGTQPMHGTPCYESEGRRFESCRAHYEIPANAAFLLHESLSDIGPNHLFDHLSFSKPSRRPRS